MHAFLLPDLTKVIARKPKCKRIDLGNSVKHIQIELPNIVAQYALRMLGTNIARIRPARRGIVIRRPCVGNRKRLAADIHNARCHCTCRNPPRPTKKLSQSKLQAALTFKTHPCTQIRQVPYIISNNPPGVKKKGAQRSRITNYKYSILNEKHKTLPIKRTVVRCDMMLPQSGAHDTRPAPGPQAGRRFRLPSARRCVILPP